MEKFITGWVAPRQEPIPRRELIKRGVSESCDDLPCMYEDCAGGLISPTEPYVSMVWKSQNVHDCTLAKEVIKEIKIREMELNLKEDAFGNCEVIATITNR